MPPVVLYVASFAEVLPSVEYVVVVPGIPPDAANVVIPKSRITARHSSIFFDNRNGLSLFFNFYQLLSLAVSTYSLPVGSGL